MCLPKHYTFVFMSIQDFLICITKLTDFVHTFAGMNMNLFKRS
jgi:hypothetical protein